MNSLINRLFKFILEKNKLISTILIILIVAIPYYGFSPYIMRIIILTGIYIILASSLNLLTGFTGQVSLGHAAFYGIGAYASALIAIDLGMPYMVSLIMAGIIAGLAAFLIGVPTLKLEGTYLSIVTLGFCEIMRLTELNWMDVTRGPLGLPGIPCPSIFGFAIDTDTEYFYLILILVTICLVTIYNIINSRTGRALISIKEDELASEAMGVNTFKYKMIAFTTSAFFAGIAGSFYAHYVTYIDPQSFTFDESIQILSMVILGGMGSIPGAIIGSIILVSVPEVLRSVQEYRMVIYGLVLVVMMLTRPQGILGNVNITKWMKEKLNKQKSQKEVA
ncbi:branched-chain amino acid ABC transporter permease [Abyssisolibacter fermentans]|uniref:branched-chain amino acid ABC transporter permease n=1 Tax=Abyssisolibacter fermentans TaxID=1766203 RepID=UPI000831732F